VEEHEQALAELEVDVTRLAGLAEQLLELSHEGGESRGSEAVDATDAATVVRAVVDRWRAAEPDRSREISVRSTDGPTPALIGPHVLERIVTNLLQNALTHGRPPVEWVVRRAGAHTVVEVTDAGPGMPPELLQLATRRFHRAPEARSRPGAGLGLSIVEQLVTGAGGELRLAPAERGGLTATVVLPAPVD
jgi:signal transduction histidine kinase